MWCWMFAPLAAPAWMAGRTSAPPLQCSRFPRPEQPGRLVRGVRFRSGNPGYIVTRRAWIAAAWHIQ